MTLIKLLVSTEGKDCFNLSVGKNLNIALVIIFMTNVTSEHISHR